MLKFTTKTKSYVAVQTPFHDEYPDHETFPKSSIKRLVDKFERTSLVHDAKGRGQKNVVTSLKCAELKERVEATPIMSSQRLASQVRLTHTTTYRTSCALTLHPYHMQVLQDLKPSDGDKRIHFCNWLQWFVHDSQHVLDTTFFSDEAWFHLSGYINS